MGAPMFRSPLFHFIARHLALLLVLSSVAIPLAAQAPPAGSTPQVVVVFNLRSNDLQLIDHKYSFTPRKVLRWSSQIPNFSIALWCSLVP